jgi:hypothetical protein
MPARVQPATGLRVAFERNGREHDSAYVPTGERALAAALRMPSRLDELQDGDRLTVDRFVARMLDTGSSA